MPDCRCAYLRSHSRTDDGPDASFQVHTVFFEVARRFVPEPGTGDFEVCRCLRCDTRWAVYHVHWSSDNSPNPDSDRYEWQECQWSDATLEQALRDQPALREERIRRAQAEHVALQARWREDDRLTALAEDYMRELATPRKVADNEWVWGDPPQRHLAVYDGYISLWDEHAHPDSGYGWTHREFLDGRARDHLPREILEQACALVRKLRSSG